jgi:ADP-ribosylation factor-binding protein GGA
MPVPHSQAQHQAAAQSINDLFKSLPSSSAPSQVPSPLPSNPVPQPLPRAAQSTPDPFAALTSPAPRQASPMHFQQSIKPQTTGNAAIDLLGGTPAPTSNLAQNSTTAAADDDEWTFASAVPDTTKELTVTNTTLNIAFNVSRESETVLLIHSRISNNTPLPVSGLTFQVAASKVGNL